MAEKKVTSAAKAAKKEASKRTAVKKTATVVSFNSETVGFRAGDVYNALASVGKALTVSEISKLGKITPEEDYLGIGWLLKEGKIREEGEKIALA